MIKYQVCFDLDFEFGDRKYHETKVCFETDTRFDAECYIDEMCMLGDYSNYYIRKIDI